MVNKYIFLFLSQIEVNDNEVCMGVLSTLIIVMIIWVILENTVFRSYMNPLITHYFGQFLLFSFK